RRGALFVRRFVLVLRDIEERHDIGVDHPQRRLRPQLASQQPDGLLVRVDVLGSAGDEARDEHALKRRHVELRLNGRFDRDFVEVGTAAGRWHRRYRTTDDGRMVQTEPYTTACLFPCLPWSGAVI